MSKPDHSPAINGKTGRSDSPTAQTRERIGKYEILGLVGKGGMGAVYRGFDPFLEREVALKVMLPQLAEDPEQKERFEREARAVARLTHPNVVTVFDLGYHTDGAPYIVMELLQGDDLLHLSRGGPSLPLRQKISIILQVLDGLGHAHKVGIVHRDIKPANVFITDEGTAKIMDFGIARLGSSSATGSGPVLGTAGYMSPEQVNGDPVDGRSDLFSVGSMLCELLSGKRPFDAETPVATLYRIAHREPVFELPPEPEFAHFLPVLGRALAKRREDRFATSAEFADTLARCLDDSSLEARRKTPLRARDEAKGTAKGEKIKTTRPFAAASSEGRREAASDSRPARADPSGLFRILRDVYVRGKSGHLHCTAGRSHRSLRIVRGQITHAISDTAGEHLGDVLVRYGVISQHDLERALESERRLGPVLSGMGLLDRERLERALGLHVREILFAMLEEAGGSHSFEELADSASECEVSSTLSTGQVILEATRRVQDPEMVRQVLGDMDRLLVLSKDPLLRSQRLTLTPADGFVLSRIDGTLSAQEVISLSPVPAEDTERSLFGLLCTGIVDYEKKDPTSRTRPHPPHASIHREEAHSRSRAAAGPEGRSSDPAPPTAQPDPPPATPATPSGRGETSPPAPASPVDESGPGTDPHPKGKSAPEASPPVVGAPSSEPGDTIREAEGLFAEGRYEDAIRNVEPLVSQVEGPLRTRAAILLARGYMKSPMCRTKAESVLLDLVRQDPRCTPAYLLLGALYRAGEQLDAARSMYEKALELEPRHRAAAAELAALGDEPQA